MPYRVTMSIPPRLPTEANQAHAATDMSVMPDVPQLGQSTVTMEQAMSEDFQEA
jgi:hypothetical protein